MALHSSYTILVRAAVEICQLLSVLHNILCVCVSMLLSSILQLQLLVLALPVTVAATEQDSRPMDSSSSEKVMARCKTKKRY